MGDEQTNKEYRPKVERRINPTTGNKEWRIEGDTLWTVGEYQP